SFSPRAPEAGAVAAIPCRVSTPRPSATRRCPLRECRWPGRCWAGSFSVAAPWSSPFRKDTSISFALSQLPCRPELTFPHDQARRLPLLFPSLCAFPIISRCRRRPLRAPVKATFTNRPVGQKTGRGPAPAGKETKVEEFLRSWGYLGIFLGIVSTGLGFPMPEELPVVVGGALAGSGKVYWWIMLPVCIVGVIVGDSFLYAIGRLWGPRLLKYNWLKPRLLPPERLAKIEQNFQQYGVRILLFARLTPGIRAPIFFTAGMTRLSIARFLIADGIYAVPGVSLLFFLGYW